MIEKHLELGLEYYREAVLDRRIFDHFLNMPEGFAIEQMTYDPSVRGLRPLIKCPHEPQYGVEPHLMVEMADAHCITYEDEDGCRHMRLYWPAFGQEAPDLEAEVKLPRLVNGQL